MTATLRRTFRYPGEDDSYGGETREELDEQGQISRPFLYQPYDNIISIYSLMEWKHANFDIEQEDIIKNLQQKNEMDNRFYQVQIHQTTRDSNSNML